MNDDYDIVDLAERLRALEIEVEVLRDRVWDLESDAAVVA